MKKFSFFLIVFLLGTVFGRYSADKDFTRLTKQKTALVDIDILEEDIKLKRKKLVSLKNGEKLALTKLTKNPKDFSNEKDKKFIRKEKDRANYEMEELYKQLVVSINNNDIEEQNRIFDEMLDYDPKHETVYKAKVSFLQDDGDWISANKTLKECVNEIPNSLYCHKRLTNIRSSSIDEKIFHGFECLKLKKDELSCMVDLAVSLRIRGDYQTAVNLFEQALKREENSVGYAKKYILFQYGVALSEMNKNSEAVEVLSKACALNSKAACRMLKDVS